jgi:hypothetical protein
MSKRQEAAVVLVSRATSRDVEAPCGTGFLVNPMIHAESAVQF